MASFIAALKGVAAVRDLVNIFIWAWYKHGNAATDAHFVALNKELATQTERFNSATTDNDLIEALEVAHGKTESNPS